MSFIVRIIVDIGFFIIELTGEFLERVSKFISSYVTKYLEVIAFSSNDIRV